MNIFNLMDPQLVIFRTAPMANALSLHLINIYKEGELDENSTVKDFLTVQKEGRRKIA